MTTLEISFATLHNFDSGCASNEDADIQPKQAKWLDINGVCAVFPQGKKRLVIIGSKLCLQAVCVFLQLSLQLFPDAVFFVSFDN